MQAEIVTVEKENDVAHIILNSPPANALGDELLGELDLAVEAVALDREIRVVIIRSALDKIFISGADLKELSALNRLEFSNYLDKMRNLFNRIEQLAKPSISVISGHCLGGGSELAISCDFRFISSGKARIGFPEVALGLLPGAGGTQRLPRLVGYSKAKEMIYLGKVIPGEEALGIGLVDRVCHSDEILTETVKFAESLAKQPTLAIAKLKECFNNPGHGKFYEGMEIEKQNVLYLFAETDDCKEGINAFLNKREPYYKGH